MMSELTIMDRNYFKSKENPDAELYAFRTKCCDESVEQHTLNKNVPEEWEQVENHCERVLNQYSNFESITPIFCDECGRLLEYQVVLYNKKTWG
ncbi:hypothetical protein HOE22_02425 [Candidatus Woesearchaeota archaeon]|jgi:hypothetical protein|nr:hypothetical protein [Candidatus Woesearchaeota archaeon]MBT4731945.1 hypothetical protein [Candidatus Woesearchaeota archaeon]